MDIDRKVFLPALKKSISSVADLKMFSDYYASDEASLTWLLDWTYPKTYEELFSSLVELPHYTNKQPFCNDAVAYSILTAMAASLEKLNDDLGVGTTRFDHGQIGLRNGTIQVAGDIFVEIGSIFTTGDLRVQSNLIDWDESSRIVVLGDLTTQNISSSGPIVIKGNLEVDHILHLHRNDNPLLVEGNISCEFLINNDHTIKVGGSIKAKKILNCSSPDDLEFMRSHLHMQGVKEFGGHLSFDSDEYHLSLFQSS